MQPSRQVVGAATVHHRLKGYASGHVRRQLKPAQSIVHLGGELLLRHAIGRQDLAAVVGDNAAGCHGAHALLAPALKSPAKNSAARAQSANQNCNKKGLETGKGTICPTKLSA